MKNLSLFLGLCLFSSFSFSANSLTIGIMQDWSSFNPITSQLASNEALFPFFLRKMVRRGADGSVIADVAEKVPALKNESGKFVANWDIRKNAKWGDGKSIVCADWQLGWQAGLNPKVSVEARNVYSKIVSIEWKDSAPQSCRVTYTTGEWSYDFDLPPLLPSSIEKAVYDKFSADPEGYDRNTSYIGNPTLKSLYNGPYVISEFKQGSHFILVRNDNFFGPRPKIDRVIVKLITDTSALKANLMSGQINAISAVGFPPDTAIMFEEEFKKAGLDYVVRFQNSGIFQGVYFNLENEILKDIKVREALSRAVDKQTLVNAFFNGLLPAADGILSPQHPAYTKQVSIYNKDKAAKLLDEAGWKLNASGVREKNGKQLQLTFKTSAGLKVLESIQVFICERYKSLGVLCNIKNEPPRALLGQSVPHGEFDLAMFGQPIPPDTSITSYFSSKEIPTAKNSWAGGNQIRINSPALDALLADFDKENSRVKRNAIIKKVEGYLQQNYSLIPVYHRREAVVLPKALKGVEDSFEGTAFTTPENWSLN